MAFDIKLSFICIKPFVRVHIKEFSYITAHSFECITVTVSTLKYSGKGWQSSGICKLEFLLYTLATYTVKNF